MAVLGSFGSLRGGTHVCSTNVRIEGTGTDSVPVWSSDTPGPPSPTYLFISVRRGTVIEMT